MDKERGETNLAQRTGARIYRGTQELACLLTTGLPLRLRLSWPQRLARWRIWHTIARSEVEPTTQMKRAYKLIGDITVILPR